MANRKTHEQFVQELAEKFSYLTVLSRYENAKTKVLINDDRCDCDPTLKLPGNAMKGKGCKACRQIASGKSKKLSQKAFENKVRSVNPHLTVLSEYSRMVDPVTVESSLCNCGPVEANSHLIVDARGWKCSGCVKQRIGKKYSLGQDEFVRRVTKINPHLTVMGDFVNLNQRVLVNDTRCACDPSMMWSKPLTQAKGAGCSCSKGMRIGQAVVKNKRDGFHKWLLEAYPFVEIISDYQGSRNPIVINDTRCGCDEFITVPNYIRSRGVICRTCSMSSGEKDAWDFLESNGFEFEAQKTFDGCKSVRSLRFDFYVNSHNLLIEVDGAHHERPVEFFGGQKAFEGVQKRDAIKNAWARQNQISLLRIRVEHENVKDVLDEFFRRKR